MPIEQCTLVLHLNVSTISDNYIFMINYVDCESAIIYELYNVVCTWVSDGTKLVFLNGKTLDSSLGVFSDARGASPY